MATHFVQVFCLLTVVAAVRSASLTAPEGNTGDNDMQRCRPVVVPRALMTHFSEGCECGKSKYYKSINNANLIGGEKDCKDRLGGRLLAIEEEAELKVVKRFLADDGDSASNFWTGASYDDDVVNFVWPSEDGENNTPFGDWIRWAPGHPDVPSTGGNLYGVELIYRGPASAMQFKTRANSQNARYICEVKSA